MWEVLLEALLDTLKIIPILFLVYLFVGYISHNSRYTSFIKSARTAGPIIGAGLGSIPQCGFSSAMADLYSKKSLTLGTLIAVFIATSDEAIPIMLEQPQFIGQMFLLLGIKFVFAIIFGLAIDVLVNLIEKKKSQKNLVQKNVLQKKETPESSILSDKESANKDLSSQAPQQASICTCACHHTKEVVEIEEHKHKDSCWKHILVHSLKHTAEIGLFLLIANIVIGIIMFYVGEENLSVLFGANQFWQPFIAGLVGLIPNCVSSVFLVEFYLAGGISFASLVAGLSTGAGVGLIILFKNNKNWKENLFIISILYVIGVSIGLIVSLFPI